MPYRPTYPVPYLTAIDATVDQDFTCLINNKDTISSSTVEILTLENQSIYAQSYTFNPSIVGGNGENSIAYFEIPANTLVNGKDYKWYTRLISDQYDVWVASGQITDLYGITTSEMRIRPHTNVEPQMEILINGERRSIATYILDTADPPLYATITLTTPLSVIPVEYDSYSIYCNFINSDEYYFKTRALPQLELYFYDSATPIVDGTTINTSTQTFTGTYSQSDSIGISYHTFELYLNGVVIDTTGEVYSSNLTYTYDRFLDDNSYTIKFIVVTNDGVQEDIGYTFNVSYGIQTVSILPAVEVNYDKNCIDIDYSSLRVINGNLDGAAQYDQTIDGDITGAMIDYYSSIYWNEISGVGSLEISDDFTQYTETKLNPMSNGTFIELKDETNLMTYDIGYDGFNFYYTIGFSDTVYVPLFETDADLVPAVMLTSDTVDEITKYYLGEDEIWYDDTDHKFAFNDLGNTYWWKITILPDRVLFAKVIDAETVVTIN